MPLIDFRSLLLMIGTLSLAQCLGMIYISLTQRVYPGFHSWTVAFILCGVGAWLLGLRGLVPDLISVVAANILLVFTFILVARGLAHFTNRPPAWLGDLVATLGLALGLAWLTYVQPSLVARIILVSLATALACLRGAQIAWRWLPQVLGKSNLLVVAPLVVSALWCLVRAVWSWLLDRDISSMITAGLFHQLTLVIMSTGGMLLAMGLILANGQRLEAELIQAQSEIKTLRGILPICSRCKKIRDDQGYWNKLETYLQERGGAQFTHSLCPQCQQEYRAELDRLAPPGP